MRYTTHFRSEEFEKAEDPIPEDLHPVGITICAVLLEPIRLRFQHEFMPTLAIPRYSYRITSGFRSPFQNNAVGGASASQHIWDWKRCAVDGQIPGIPLQRVFDWIRLESGLGFDQVILERGRQARHEGDDCIHISWTREPRRMALLGPTGGRGGYLAQVVNPPTGRTVAPDQMWG